MKSYLLAYAATALVFLALDFVWLSVAGNALYRPLLGDLLRERFELAPAVAFYLIYTVGIVFFAIAPAMETNRWQTALIHGALFGFFAYATYDLTNQATLTRWSIVVTLADLAWGTLLTGVAAASGYAISQAIVKG